MSDIVITKDNLYEALDILQQVFNEPPLTKKQRLEALLAQAEELQKRITEYEQK